MESNNESNKESNNESNKESNNESNKESTKKIKLRCFHCNKKLKVIYFTCECNHLFCNKHRYKHDHNCKLINYKYIDKIKENNPKIIPSKIQII